MKKKYIITEEEFEVIKEAISKVLEFWQYETIEAKSENGRSMLMSDETFFENLKREFIIEPHAY